MSTEDVVFGMLACMPCGALLVDRGGRILAANRRFHELLGYEADELVGSSVDDLVPEAARAAHPGHRASFLAAPVPRAMIEGRGVEAVHRDGSIRLVEVGLAACPLLDDGHTLATMVDVTERDGLRQRQSARSDEDGNLVSEVVGALAHQFNNQITSVVGTLELALDGVQDDRTRALLATALIAADRASAVTRQVLGLGQRGGAPSQRSSLADGLRSIAPTLQAIVSVPHTLELHLVEHEGHVGLGVADIGQIVLSLVRNAVDALRPGGTIQVRVEPLAHGDAVCLVVEDDGVGIEDSLLPHVSSPFVTSHPERPGAGLGLTSVRALAEQAGGRLELRSPGGGGTTARVTLPLLAAEDAPRPSSSRGRILVVDDERLIRETVADALGRRGHDVLLASGADEAVEVFENEGRIDLLLTDIVMPNVDGVELARELRRRRPGLQVLFMSGFSRDVLERHGLDQEQMQLLPKPFTVAAATGRVEGMLEGAED